MPTQMKIPFDALDETPLLQDIRHNLKRHGRDAVRDMVPAAERKLVDIIAALAEEESQEFGVTYSGFAMISLPHKRLPDDQPWERVGYRVTLTIEPGRLLTRGTKTTLYGVPFGSKARMILFYLQTQALRQRSREISLGPSLHAWMESLGFSDGGKGYADVREQVARLAACKLTLSRHEDMETGRGPINIKGGFVTATEGLTSIVNPRQGTLWDEKILLDETFYKELVAHPLPLWEPALKQIGGNSTAIDIYVWLAWRLHALTEPTPISWLSLYDQFGAGYSRLRDFRKRFIESLKLALAAYEDAKVHIGDEGLLLLPSPSPVPKAQDELRRLQWEAAAP